jgi:hypothetical protein
LQRSAAFLSARRINSAARRSYDDFSIKTPNSGDKP